MNTTYPRTPLLARFGYLLLIAAAGVLSFPIVADIYKQWTISDKPISTVDQSIADLRRGVPLGDSEEPQENAVTAGNQPKIDHVARKPVPVGTDSNSVDPLSREATDRSFENQLGEDKGSGSGSGPLMASDEQSPSEDSKPASTDTVENDNTFPEMELQEVQIKNNSPTTEGPAAAVQQQTAKHDGMLTPGNFTYLGAFRLPHLDGQESRFAYGGHAITFRPDGDPQSDPDGFPGSLVMVGHKQHELVAEVNIPRPVVSPKKNMDQLSVADILQPFSDITNGRRSTMTAGSSEPFQFGGLQYLDGNLHWTLFKYYNVSGVDYLSHGISSVDLMNPKPKGMWHLGPRDSGKSVWHSYKHAGYIAQMPQQIADQYFEGRNLMSGLQISTGLKYSSQGPALYAYQAPSGQEPDGSSLDATPLLWYPMDNPIDQHHPADLWAGAAWVNVNGKHSVVIAGRKAHGPVHYGDARPTDCYPDKGYHGSSYEVQLLFYAPAHLHQASQKRIATVQPWYRWDSNSEGGGIDRFMFQECGREVGGLAYDRENNLLYLSEMSAGYTSDNEWEPLPIIHVFRLGDS